MPRLVLYAFAAALTAALGLGLSAVGLPSPLLFGALLAGLVVALVDRRAAVAVPAPAFAAAQAVTGVTIGAYVETSSLEALGGAWLPVTAVILATLALSVGAGALLSRATALDRTTGALGMIAGGASGIVAMADELGADGRVVAFMQYLRVLVVVLSLPLLVGLLFGAHEGAVPNPGAPLLGEPLDWLLVPAVAAVGVLVGRRSRLPVPTLLGPMVLGAVLALTLLDDLAVPPLAREGAFVLIGLQVGLRFTPEAVRLVGRLVVPVLAAVVGLIAVSFGLAALLAVSAPVSLLDAYLATTPGGLYAVLAIGFDSGADTTFVLALQTLRLFAMVLLAPLAVRWAARADGGRHARARVRP
jgi:hypothetical protein